MIIILTCYFAVLHFGQNLMQNRRPFQLRLILISYNCLQVILSSYICKEVALTAYLSNYKFECSEIEDTNKELTIRVK